MSDKGGQVVLSGEAHIVVLKEDNQVVFTKAFNSETEASEYLQNWKSGQIELLSEVCGRY